MPHKEDAIRAMNELRHEAQLEQYEEYFNDCELANKIPLTFDNWKKEHNYA